MLSFLINKDRLRMIKYVSNNHIDMIESDLYL